jgi:SAM-dependent methyltransferase
MDDKACEFCNSPMQPRYETTIADVPATMYRCGSCQAHRILPPIPDEALAGFYARTYFTLDALATRKAQWLARDYLSKVLRFGFLDQPAGKCLEIGASYGFFAALLAERTSVDILEPFQACHEHVRQHFPKVHIAGRTLADLPAEAVYDNVFCFHTVEHLPGFEGFLDDLHPHVAPGGRLWILTPNASARGLKLHGRTWGWAAPKEHTQFIPQGISREYLQKHGWVVSVERDLAPPPFHMPSEWWLRLTKWFRCWESKPGGIARLMKSAIDQARHPFRPRQVGRLPWLAVERFWSITVQRRPFDELLLVLRRLA